MCYGATATKCLSHTCSRREGLGRRPANVHSECSHAPLEAGPPSEPATTTSAHYTMCLTPRETVMRSQAPIALANFSISSHTCKRAHFGKRWSVSSESAPIARRKPKNQEFLFRRSIFRVSQPCAQLLGRVHRRWRIRPQVKSTGQCSCTSGAAAMKTAMHTQALRVGRPHARARGCVSCRAAEARTAPRADISVEHTAACTLQGTSRKTNEDRWDIQVRVLTAIVARVGPYARAQRSAHG